MKQLVGIGGINTGYGIIPGYIIIGESCKPILPPDLMYLHPDKIQEIDQKLSVVCHHNSNWTRLISHVDRLSKQPVWKFASVPTGTKLQLPYYDQLLDRPILINRWRIIDV